MESNTISTLDWDEMSTQGETSPSRVDSVCDVEMQEEELLQSLLPPPLSRELSQD